MSVYWSKRSLSTLTLVSALMIATPQHEHARADSSAPATTIPATPQSLGATGVGGVLDPYVPPATQAQLDDHARRIAGYQAKLAAAQRTRGITPNSDPGSYGGDATSVNVTAYAEPNSYTYRNYCGPGASQVLLSNWTPNVPTIDTLASQEKTDPSWGTYLSNMVNPINSDGNTGGFYINQVAGSQGALSNWIGADIWVSSHPLITAIETQGGGYSLQGWTLQAAHIITIYGFDFYNAPNSVAYVETAGTVAGTNYTGYVGAYNYDKFWYLVTQNNGQIW